VGDGVAFTRLLQGTCARGYGSEIDAYRVEQARSLGIEVLQADALEARCPIEVLSLLYLDPPYDFEIGATNNQRLELVFLERTYRWLKPGGVPVLVIPPPHLRVCARILSEHFTDLSMYRLTDPESVQYKQLAVLGVRRRCHQDLRDSALLDSVRRLEMLASKPDLEPLGQASESRYEIPPSGPVTLTQLEFHSMTWRTCCQIRRHTVRQAAFSSPSSETFGAGHSRPCMAGMSACSVPRECSTEHSAKSYPGFFSPFRSRSSNQQGEK
jgi:hypothetical protein